MAKASEDPAVRTYADHEVIVPPNRLKRAITRAAVTDPDPIARAEAALANLADDFSAWMKAECEKIDAVRRNIRKAGLSDNLRNALFRAAHDIRGEASTFGYPRAGEVAESLCRLLEHTPNPARIPLAMIDQHVDAIRAIVREARDQSTELTATHLASQIRTVTDAFLAHENRERPDYLDGILAPPLSPNGA